MQHMLSRGRSTDPMFLLATLGAVTMLLCMSPTTSAFAEQLVALGQERAQVSDRTTTKTVSTPKQPAPVRKSHKLIRKSAPVASVQLNDITTPPTDSTALKAPTAAPSETTATQIQSKDATALSSTTSSTVCPSKINYHYDDTHDIPFTRRCSVQSGLLDVRPARRLCQV